MQKAHRYGPHSASVNTTLPPSLEEGEDKKKKYQQPDQPFAAFLWRLSLWVSVTFGLSVMEPWEKLFVGKYLIMEYGNRRGPDD